MSTWLRAPLACRQRLARVVAPVLRLVLLVLANAPGSESVRADAEAFVARHLVLFQRLLREVVMPGETYGWWEDRYMLVV